MVGDVLFLTTNLTNHTNGFMDSSLCIEANTQTAASCGMLRPDRIVAHCDRLLNAKSPWRNDAQGRKECEVLVL